MIVVVVVSRRWMIRREQVVCSQGSVSFAEDRTFIEDDQNTSLTALSTFDDVAGVKEQIAEGVEPTLFHLMKLQVD